MKVLVIADTHLGSRFNQRKYDFLKKIISDSDKVIINGDFWEGYEMTFDRFVKSPWKALFHLLKQRKAVYLYGNHDKKEFSDKRVSLFSTEQGYQYKLKSGKFTFYFEHGDKLTPFTDDLIFKGRAPWIVSLIWTITEYFLVKFTGMWATTQTYERFNKRIKKNIASKLKKNEVLICGHTSVPHFDIDNHYINGGWIKHGIGQYLVIEDGKVTPKNERY